MSDYGFPYLEAEEEFRFPSPGEASPEGIVAVGGNLSPGMLVSAYSQGIFPWFSEGEPILWWSPNPRCILAPGEVHVSRSMSRILKGKAFSFSMDRNFADVISACANTPRPDQDGTWITREMMRAYIRLHESGYAHSLEVWSAGRLVGGLYGVSLGGMFFGESMFSRLPNASKAAFIALCGFLEGQGFDCLDCQIPTPHLASLGAGAVSREDYLNILSGSLRSESRIFSWSERAGRWFDEPRS